MQTFDRILFSVIAAALAAIALNPWLAPGLTHAQMARMDVNIVAVGGKSVRDPGMSIVGELSGIPVIITEKR